MYSIFEYASRLLMEKLNKLQKPEVKKKISIQIFFSMTFGERKISEAPRLETFELCIYFLFAHHFESTCTKIKCVNWIRLTLNVHSRPLQNINHTYTPNFDVSPSTTEKTPTKNKNSFKKTKNRKSKTSRTFVNSKSVEYVWHSIQTDLDPDRSDIITQAKK